MMPTIRSTRSEIAVQNQISLREPTRSASIVPTGCITTTQELIPPRMPH